MWSDGDNRDLILIRIVAPEYTIRTRRTILYVSFKDLSGRIVRIFDQIVFVRIENWGGVGLFAVAQCTSVLPKISLPASRP